MDATEKGAVFLPDAIMPATSRPMGRPPLNLTRVPVRLSPEALARIDALVGTYGRAGFIRDAVERELEWREKGK